MSGEKRSKLKSNGAKIIPEEKKNLQLETAFSENLPKASQNNIVCTPPPPFCRGGIENPTKFSKGGLDKTSLLEEGCWEREGDFFSGGRGLQFSLKI